MAVSGTLGSGANFIVVAPGGLLTGSLPYPPIVNKRYPMLAPRIAFVGDSITAGGTYGPAVADPIDPSLGQDIRSGYGAWAWLGTGYTNGKALFAGVAAKASSTVVNYPATPGWTATWLTNAMKVKPDAVVFLDGTNDMLYWPNSTTPTGIPTTAQWKTFVQQKVVNVRTCLALGVTPVICSILPRIITGGVACTQVPIINAFYKALAAQFNVPFIDLYTPFANVDGSIKAGYLLGDNTHPTTLGIQTMAQTFSTTLLGYLGNQTLFGTWWNSGDILGANTSLHPLFGATLNTTNPVVVPGGYTTINGATSFYTGSYVVDDTGVTAFNQASINAGFNDGVLSPVVTAAATTFAVGDLIQIIWKVKFVNPTGSTGYAMNMNVRDQTWAITAYGYESFVYDTNSQWVTLCKEFKVAGGVTGINTVQNFDTTGGAGVLNGNFTMGPISMINLTKLNMNVW